MRAGEVFRKKGTILGIKTTAYKTWKTILHIRHQNISNWTYTKKIIPSSLTFIEEFSMIGCEEIS